ncbi:capsular polysaccharide synthesis protein [Vagococcus fluvialis]|uniref:Capsular polysaccharide synthesis protein n=1 Tax=Vagococcus fluvialis TaxID=2738 RepID=A0A7X6D6Z8_9ENTE|nr:capsular polysaccharide synthesis protein [Vagococcus fluvialis]MBO0487244.1 hypothetical protein [Vagococcus fluvialis]NKC66919.1 hypothetical protein [Vagococcus fluvialis]
MGFISVLNDYKIDKKNFGYKIAKSKSICRILFSLDSKLSWNLPLKKIWLREFKKKEVLIYEFLEKKNEHLIKKYEEKEFLNTEPSDIIWICWFQGIENAPENVKFSYSSIQKQFSNQTIIILDDTNIESYLNIPKDIFEMWRKGKISNQLFSDIVRTDLLFNHGGLWLDATCFIFDKPLINYKNYESFYATDLVEFPSDYNYIDIDKFEAYFVYSKKNNQLFKYLNESLIEYCRNSEELVEYLLINYFAKIGRKRIEEFSKQHSRIPKNNSECEIIRRKLNRNFSEIEIAKDTFFVKLNANEVYSTKHDCLFEHLKKKGMK